MANRGLPSGLDYSNLKPEVIDNEIKLIRFTPTGAINAGVNAGQQIKFIMQGNGFFDPYSAYIRMEVSCTTAQNGLLENGAEIRFLDRSAHSFINRLVIRSQGVELERIEEYDVVAAMINDMIYSQEQNNIKSWEGFPLAETVVDSEVINEPRIEDVIQRRRLAQILQGNSARTDSFKYLGERAFYTEVNAINLEDAVNGGAAGVINQFNTNAGFDMISLPAELDLTLLGSVHNVPTSANIPGLNNSTDNNNGNYLVTFGGHARGVAVPTIKTIAGNRVCTLPDSTTYTFIIPIYSGLIGVLQPEKKFIPLQLLPLDLEFTLNPHALYSSLRGNGAGRGYSVKRFDLYAHMLFFEQDIHRSLEASVAVHGLFMHVNSFYLAPQTVFSGNTVPGFCQLTMHFKSINSVHFVFMYQKFQTDVTTRKLHFVSHNLRKLQIRNGTFLLPSEPIEAPDNGSSGDSFAHQNAPFLIELMKAWGKLHDPATDAALLCYNVADDIIGVQQQALFSTLQQMLETADLVRQNLPTLLGKQSNVGRCQYAISFEGEELGSDDTLLTGKKANLPFDINMMGFKSEATVNSQIYPFLRHDFIVYVRPDLVVTVMGK